ncbi:hypothetical protein SUGI_0914950 [Cryptomeria japonica]|nr:hypothetical protein SUGI_0914950 [Cryptomeria japonica]
MAKCAYVFLLFLLLTPPFAVTSESPVEDYGHPGFCRSVSGGFHGACVAWRKNECNSVCENIDRQEFGECDWGPKRIGLACWCFHDCGK